MRKTLLDVDNRGIQGSISNTGRVAGSISSPSLQTTWGSIFGNLENQHDLMRALEEKQAVLVSGENIKTINGIPILGSGDIVLVTNYEELQDKPKINGVVISGDKTGSDFNIIEANPETEDLEELSTVMINGRYFKLMGGVTGIKGNAETEYRTGDINITAENIGITNKPAVQYGVDDTLVTTGDKYAWYQKQTKLISEGENQNIKTLNNESILGSGNITIPTALSELSDDDDHKLVTSAQIASWDGKSGFDGDYNNLFNKPTQLTDFTNNLVPDWALSENKPIYSASDVGALPDTTVIPSALSQLSSDQNHNTVSTAQINSWTAKSDFSGNYSDLSGAPTKLSDFTNDTNFVTGEYHDSTKQDTITDIEAIRSGAALGATSLQANEISAWAKAENKPAYDYSEIANTPTIPTVPQNVSAFNNDAGYLTEHQSLTGYATESWVTNKGYITGISSTDITTALGYTPYNATNPSGFGTGTITEIKLNGETVATSGVANIVMSGGASSADQVSYSNPDYPTVKAALDELLYVAPVISNFKVNGAASKEYENGESVSSVTFTYDLNKDVTSININQSVGSIDATLREYTYTPASAYTSDKAFTMTVSDGKNSPQAIARIYFRNRGYFGVSTKATLEDSDILAFTDKNFVTARKTTKTFNCSGGKYFYIVLPASLCSGISFKVGGLAFSDYTVVTRNVTNASGKAVSYNIYRPNNIQTGSSISVEVL